MNKTIVEPKKRICSKCGKAVLQFDTAEDYVNSIPQYENIQLTCFCFKENKK